MSDIDPYASWSRVLLDRFFGYHMAGQRTRLMVTREMLDEEYAHFGGSAAFIEAVEKGPYFIADLGLSLHETALKLWRVWNAIGDSEKDIFDLPDGAPPYLPHLGVLCLGWTIEDDQLAANAFYDRLGRVVPHHGLDPNHLREWRALWDSLEEWTSRLEWKRGIFRVELLGHLVHVGIPLSQVLLTGPRIARLPEFFVTTGLAAMASRGVVTGDHVRNVVASDTNRAGQFLGQGMTSEIIGGTELGNASIERLQDYLEDPDFRRWTPIIGPGNGGGDRPDGEEGAPKVPVIPLRLVMEKVDVPDGWRCFFGVLGEDPPSDESGWSFRKVDNAFGGLWLASTRHTGDGFLDACEFGLELTGDEVRIKVEDNSGNDAEEMALQLPRRAVRVFPVQWHGQMLVEDGTLPGEGGCFVLVGPASQVEFQGWCDRFKRDGGRVTDYTLSGLRQGTAFFHLDRLEALSPALRNDFPSAELAATREPQRIALVGGSQVQSAGRQKAYLPFDLPEVVFDCPVGAELDCDGAKLEELESTSVAPEGFPGDTIRQYHFVGEAEEDVVTITSTSSDSRWVPETKVFGISRDASLVVQGEKARFNEFGRKFDGPGILGARIDKEAQASETGPGSWDFDECSIELGRALDEEAVDDPAWHLLESIAQGRRVTTTEFRRRAEKILGWWDRYAWQEARWTRALCHIEVERDARGRLAYLYPVPVHAYLLPAKERGSHVAVLAGCPTGAQLRSLLGNSTEARGLDVEIRVTDRNEKLLPPCVSISATDLGNLELVLGCLDIPLAMGGDTGTPMPACAGIASWAGSIESWKDSLLRWIPGLPPDTEEKRDFSPYAFRMTQDPFRCPYRLRSMKDSQTEKHRWHVLHDNGGLLRDEQYAFLVDPAWGKWYSAYKVAPAPPEGEPAGDDRPFPVPYEVETRTLVVPASLVFPTILSRALLTATGMPPVKVNQSIHYSREGSRFLPEKDEPYSGTCFRYEEVPFQIAQAVCEKVYAEPIPVQSNPGT